MNQNANPRRVVSGTGPHGRSLIESDGPNPNRLESPAFTINQIWQVPSLPPHVGDLDASGGNVTITPPAGGFVYLITTFPPDSSYDVRAEYEASLESSGGAGSYLEDEIPGMHQTDTVDIITMISGSLYAVTEQGETCLNPGDSFIQRGTRHTWSNRSDKPATMVAVMMGATR